MSGENYQPETGHRVRVRRYHVTGSLDTADGGEFQSEQRGQVTRTGAFHEDGSFIFWLDDGPDHIAPGYVFLGKDDPQGPGTYLVTTVEPDRDAWRDAVGALADVWDGEPAEVTIRRIRDGWDGRP
jgi:hypothetical protein